MLKKIGIILLFAAVVGARYAVPLQGLPLLSDTAFALYQDDGQPCPPECVTDSMEIVTYYPSPYGYYEELRGDKIIVGDTDNSRIDETHLPPSGTITFEPLLDDPDASDGNLYEGSLYYQGAIGGTKGKFRFYDGLGWQDLGGGAYWDVSPFDSNDIYYTPSGNVGIGTNSPSYKLDVRNGRTNVSELCINEDCKTTWPAGVNGTEIPTASVSSLKGYIEVKIGNNFYALPYYNYILNQALSMGSHTTHDCINAGGTAVVENSVRFCKFSASSCPIGWTQYQGWSTTEANHCASTIWVCNQGCTTSSHNWSDNSTVETCTVNQYSRDRVGTCYWVGSYTCFPTKKEVGCW